MIRRLSVLSIILLLIAVLGAIPHGSALAVPKCGTDHTVCTPTPTATPVATPTPHPTTTPGAGMSTTTKTFVFASTAESWTSIAALASGETNGLDTTLGNPADSLFAKITGKSKTTTTGAGLKISGDIVSFWGMPSGAILTGVTVTLDKKQTASSVQGASNFWRTKLTLGASTNTGASQTVGTGADGSWVNVASGSNAALSALSAASGTLELDILYGLSTSSSATTTSTQQVNWDNIAVTLTYSVPIIQLVQKGPAAPNDTLAGLTIGNLIVFSLPTNIGDTVTISDTAGNTWVPLPTAVGAHLSLQSWYAAQINATSTTLRMSGNTLTNAGADVSGLWSEYKTTAAGQVLGVDQATSGTTTSTSLTVTTGTTAAAEEMNVAEIIFYAESTNGAGAISALYQFDTSDGALTSPTTQQYLAHQNVFSSGTQSVNATVTYAVGGGEMDGLLLTLFSYIPPLAPAPHIVSQAVKRASLF